MIFSLQLEILIILLLGTVKLTSNLISYKYKLGIVDHRHLTYLGDRDSFLELGLS